MDLDFKTVRALSSPTRIKILRHAMEEEATTTKLSREVGKSKSTISSHLEKLVRADLLEKDKEEGRKRVVYRPTDKSKAIVNGRTKKVKFSVVSSAVTAITGLVLLWPVLDIGSNLSDDSDALTGPEYEADMMMEDAARDTVEESGRELVQSEPFLLASVAFFGIAVSALAYGLILRSFPEPEELNTQDS